jgi:hypothetical protein
MLGQLSRMLQDKSFACKAQEYEDDGIADAELSPEERLAAQRRNLKRKLGLDGDMEKIMDTDDLIKDEDLVTATSAKVQSAQSGQKDAASLISDMTGRAPKRRSAVNL